MPQLELKYWSTRCIVDYYVRHPVSIPTSEEKKKIDTAGNKHPPTPAMGVFFDCLNSYGRLFTDMEYVGFAWSRPEWDAWKMSLTQDIADGISIRLAKQFMLSAIDSMHVWAILVESGCFSKCLLDIAEDAVKKTDITVWSKSWQPIRIALRTDTPRSNQWHIHKTQNRGAPPHGTIEVLLTMDKCIVGGKRWYVPDDFSHVIALAQNNGAGTSARAAAPSVRRAKPCIPDLPLAKCYMKDAGEAWEEAHPIPSSTTTPRRPTP